MTKPPLQHPLLRPPDGPSPPAGFWRCRYQEYFRRNIRHGWLQEVPPRLFGFCCPAAPTSRLTFVAQVDPKLPALLPFSRQRWIEKGTVNGVELPLVLRNFLGLQHVEPAVQCVASSHPVNSESLSWSGLSHPAALSASYPTGIRLVGAPGSASNQIELFPSIQVFSFILDSTPKDKIKRHIHNPFLPNQGRRPPHNRQHLMRIIDEGQGCFFVCAFFSSAVEPPA